MAGPLTTLQKIHLDNFMSQLLADFGYANGLGFKWSNQLDTPLAITADRTIYVTTAGSDVTGDGSLGSPFASIQKAIDSVRGIDIQAFVTISVGPGTFSGFYLDGLRFHPSNPQTTGSIGIRVVGTVGSPIVSGTVTASASAQITDSTKSWSVDQFKGKFLQYSSFGSIYYAPIIGNTATVIGISTIDAPDVSSAYAIVDLATIISGNATDLGTPVFGSGPAGAYSMMIGTNVGSTLNNIVWVNLLQFNGTTEIDSPCTISACRWSIPNNKIGVNLFNPVYTYIYASSFELKGSAGFGVQVFSASAYSGAWIDECYFHNISGGVGGVALAPSLSYININWIRCESLSVGVDAPNGVTGSFSGTFKNCTTIANIGRRSSLNSQGSLGVYHLGGSTGNTNGLVLTNGAVMQIDPLCVIGATNEVSIDGVVTTLATMRGNTPKVFPTTPNVFGTYIYQ